MANRTDELIINPEEVNQSFRKCLYTPEEVEGLKEGEIPKGAILVKGVRCKYAFHPQRLEEQRPKVVKWLQALPHTFRKNKGEGWSFLNACLQENGVRWTGFQERVDQLFCMALGLKLAEYTLPEETWQALPGGVPYYTILIE